jgi:hypothetical protein
VVDLDALAVVVADVVVVDLGFLAIVVVVVVANVVVVDLGFLAIVTVVANVVVVDLGFLAIVVVVVVVDMGAVVFGVTDVGTSGLLPTPAFSAWPPFGGVVPVVEVVVTLAVDAPVPPPAAATPCWPQP